jgi:deoxyribodipyrimidine photo-lyase
MRATERIFLTAASFRRYLQEQGTPSFPLRDPLAVLARAELPKLTSLDKALPDVTSMPNSIDASVGPVADVKGGTVAARERLRAFIKSDAASSGLSPYLHFGHISPQEIDQEVISSKRPDSEHFLDELVTWRELGFNMCAHASNYDQYDSLPQWAQRTLAKHKLDVRPVIYEMDQLEKGATHDDLWNSAEMQLVAEGRIENRLRMLWGKKIIEWSRSPEDALAVMIHLNNKYALDGRDPNSYTGIFWTLGRYDRPWGPERPIFGLVRYMSSANTARKLRKKQ